MSKKQPKPGKADKAGKKEEETEMLVEPLEGTDSFTFADGATYGNFCNFTLFPPF